MKNIIIRQSKSESYKHKQTNSYEHRLQKLFHVYQSGCLLSFLDFRYHGYEEFDSYDFGTRE